MLLFDLVSRFDKIANRTSNLDDFPSLGRKIKFERNYRSSERGQIRLGRSVALLTSHESRSVK